MPPPLTTTLGAPTGDPVALAARNLARAAELVAIVRRLDDARIPSIVLKGVPLAYRLFGRLDARRIRDNDVLVRRSDLPRAVGVLAEIGYEMKSPWLRLDKEFARTNQLAMVRRGTSGHLAYAELHWNAFHPWFFAVPAAIQWARTRPFPLHGVTVTVFDEALTLLHLAAHLAQHAFSEASNLRDVAAAWNAWHRDLDREDVRRLSADTGTAAVLEFALRAAEDLGLLVAPPPRPRSWQAALLRRILPTRRLFEPRPSPDHKRNLLIFILAGPRRLPSYLAQGLFPTIESMSSRYGLPVSRRLYLHYAGRPFRAVRRALRAPPRS